MQRGMNLMRWAGLPMLNTTYLELSMPYAAEREGSQIGSYSRDRLEYGRGT